MKQVEPKEKVRYNKGWANLKPAKKGEPSRNPAGRPPKKKLLTEYMNHKLDEIEPKSKRTYGDLLAEMTIKKAMQGHNVALKEIWDRSDGKVAQKIEGSMETTHKVELTEEQKQKHREAVLNRFLEESRQGKEN